MPALLRRPAVVALILGIAAQLLFSVHLGRPSTLVFDEVHYVPAARTLLALDHPTNTEHPLLGKEMIAAGIAIFGDNAIGWRALSTLAGTATVLGVFAILMVVFGRLRTATCGAIFAALNFTLFVQARIAMLDVFLGAFVTLAIAAMLGATRGHARARWTLASVLLGLATAVKWAAAPYVAFAALTFVALRARRPWLWPGLGTAQGLAILGGVSVATYALTFAPAFFYAQNPLTFADLIPFQLEMWARQTQVLSPHTYQSNWPGWPVMARPIWYLYEPVDGAQRGILLVGNPAVMWGGLVAVATLGWAWWTDGDARAGGLAALWSGSLAIWAIIPKSLGFYYYYHLSGIFVAIALAGAFHVRATGTREGWIDWYAVVVLAAFVWFYPILSAAALPDPQAFNRWMWFDSWR